MPKSRGWVAVLWGDNFDETAATIFVTEFREAGLWAKVVGLSPPYISGSHGLVLMPDLTLDQALTSAQDAIGVVIPHASPGIKRLKNDPRLQTFCEQAAKNEAKFVVGWLDEADLGDLVLFPLGEKNLVIYPTSENLVEFARDLTKALLLVR